MGEGQRERTLGPKSGRMMQRQYGNRDSTEREKATKMTGGRGSVGGGATEKVAERKKVTERERLALNQEERCSSTMGTAAVQVRNDGSASGEWRLWLLEDSVFFQNPSCESLESPVESRRRWRRVLTASVR
ncbi:hypothetical protein VNO78_32927 [Psophocarpus tetragonolobus]|uniref:Uncharacterized protein n=1 Tax=Psophocarpus tetragonolobus TaxID=3891 RepID=A0AAN9RQC7_PSOTE